MLGANGSYLRPVRRQSLNDLQRIIRRTVIDDNDLQVLVRLSADGFDGLTQHRPTVVHWYYDTDVRVRHEMRLGLLQCYCPDFVLDDIIQRPVVNLKESVSGPIACLLNRLE